MTLSPLQRRRWRSFRANPRAFWSLWIFGLLFVVTLGAEFVANAATGTAAGQSETLYVELRRGKETLDPAEWFVMNPIVGDATQGGTGQNATGQDGTE